MALDITSTLERFLTHEFVAVVDFFLVFAKLAGVALFIKFAMEAYRTTKAQGGNQQFTTQRDQQANMTQAIMYFIASTLMWRFGEGIAAWGELFWGLEENATKTKYTMAVYQQVVTNAQTLVNQSVGGENQGILSPIALKACFAVASLYGLYSYTKGVLGLISVVNPMKGGEMSMSKIVVHIVSGVFLIYIDLLYETTSNSLVQATATA